MLLLNGWNFFIKILKDAFQVMLFSPPCRIIESFFYCLLLLLLFPHLFVSALLTFFFDNVYCSSNTALRRSKKRVRAVITTELPFLMSKEFSFNQENENSTDRFSNSASADMHHARWSTMFDQMEKALTEEEKQLVSISK